MVMRSFQSIAASIAFSALMAAGATCAGAEDEPLGVRLVNQMNALYGQHPGVRANHAKGAVFEGIFKPAQGASRKSSTSFAVTYEAATLPSGRAKLLSSG